MCDVETKSKGMCTSDPNIPPKVQCQEQFLFLLELYVRCVQSPRLAKLNGMFCVPTTVGFCFLDFKPDDELQITPVDPVFEPLSGIGDYIEPFYSGRSVCFALSNESVCDTCKGFKIFLRVFKRMPKNVKPDVLVGTATIDMSMHFAAVRKELLDNIIYNYTGSCVPDPAKIFDDIVPLCFEGQQCGKLDVYARISAYGQTIVTEFEAPDIERESAISFLFKSTDQNCEEQKLCYNCRTIDPKRCDLSDILSETSSKDDCRLCKPTKMPCQPCKIATGAILRNKSPVGSSRKKCDVPRDCKRMHAGGGGCTGCCGQQGKGEPDSCTNPCPIQTSRGPKEPCGKAVVLKVSGLVDVCNDGKPQDPCVTVLPESEATDPKDIEKDPDHDVFILRIGKKGLVGAGEKSDIQLEMRTPKGPDRRPPVRLETREMQTEDDHGKKRSSKKKK